ncbi:nuclease, partial [Rhodococcus erythropolis]|nr:nuclease [Rhodococcus erythropolis]
DWLAERAAEHGVELREPTGQIKIPLEELTESEIALREFAGHKAGSARTPDQQAAALLAAAVGYHNRERKPYWWAHFDRLVTPIEDLVDIRDVMVVEQSEIEADWHKSTPRQKKFRRHIQLTGSFGTGTSLSPGSDLFALYATPSPDAVASENPTQRGTSSVKVTAVVKSEGLDVVTVEELLGGDEYLDAPVALAPGRPIPTGRMEKSIAAAASGASEILPELPPVAAVDILRRSTPRTRSGSPLPPVGTDNNYADAITAALLDLDDSYVAVQGPPGTGKTYTG